MEEMQKEEGLNILEIIRILLQKIKILILVVIIGAASGAFLGFWRYANVKNYGTSIEFYINPEKPKDLNSTNAAGSQYGVYGAYGRHVMDAMVKLLESESFAEQLMLNGELLPCVNISKAETESDYYPNLDEQKYINATKAISDMEKIWDEIAEKYDKNREYAIKLVEEEWKKAGQINAFTLSAYQNLLTSGRAPESLINAYKAYDEINEKREEAIKKANEEQKKADDVVEVFLEEWRSSEKYKENLEIYNESVTYSYLGDDENVEDANNLARSFIYVEIDVLNDETFANILLERVKTVVPDYIETHMIVPTDYEGTTCTRITRTNDIEYLNPNLARNQAIKFAFLLAVAAGIIAAVVVIVVDTQDKRLRDHEIITRKFNVPVLGIVPTIEEMKQAVELKKHKMKKNGKGVK